MAKLLRLYLICWVIELAWLGLNKLMDVIGLDGMTILTFSGQVVLFIGIGLGASLVIVIIFLLLPALARLIKQYWVYLFNILWLAAKLFCVFMILAGCILVVMRGGWFGVPESVHQNMIQNASWGQCLLAVGIGVAGLILVYCLPGGLERKPEKIEHGQKMQLSWLGKKWLIVKTLIFEPWRFAVLMTSPDDLQLKEEHDKNGTAYFGYCRYRASPVFTEALLEPVIGWRNNFAYHLTGSSAMSLKKKILVTIRVLKRTQAESTVLMDYIKSHFLTVLCFMNVARWLNPIPVIDAIGGGGRGSVMASVLQNGPSSYESGYEELNDEIEKVLPVLEYNYNNLATTKASFGEKKRFWNRYQ